MNEDQATDLEPPAVVALRATLERLPGIVGVVVAFKSLVGFDVEHLRFAEMADLPSASLRRTQGGLDGESLIQVEIRVAPKEASWLTLEFLAWVARDSARGGDVTQLRVRGLPPQVGDRIQVGTTLAFLLEWFVVHPMGDLESLLSRVQQEAVYLNSVINMYGHLIGALPQRI